MDDGMLFGLEGIWIPWGQVGTRVEGWGAPVEAPSEVFWGPPLRADAS